MKTSNRLLLGTIAALVIYVSAAFVELRIKGDYNRRTYNTDSVALPTFNHLVIKGLDQRVYIEKSDTPMISTRTIRENPLAKVDYEMKGDTLVINDLGLQDNDQGDFTIHTGLDIQSLTSVDSYYHLQYFAFDSLIISQHGGRGALSDCKRLVHLELTVKWRGEFDTFDTPLESVKLDMERGNVEFRSPINVLKGSMTDDSYLSVSGIQDFQFKKDRTSILSHYN